MAHFDTASPIWVQLVADFSRRIAVGQWPAGGRIAGVRELAAELGVNPNTVQRALSELEREGLCRSERTSGRFVTSDEARIQRLRAQLAHGAADDFLRRARGLGLGRNDLHDLIDERWPADGADGTGERGSVGPGESGGESGPGRGERHDHG